MAGGIMQISLILAATDRMSAAIRSAGDRIGSLRERIKKISLEASGLGAALQIAGSRIMHSFDGAVAAFRELEQSQMNLKMTALQADETAYGFSEISRKAEEMRRILPLDDAALLQMAASAYRAGMSMETLLAGGLETAAKLRVALRPVMGDYQQAAEDLQQMKNALRLRDSDLAGFADLYQRAIYAGASAESLTRMAPRAGKALVSLGMNGMQAAREVFTLTAYFDTMGESGRTASMALLGMLEAMSPQKLREVNDIIAMLGGKRLVLFDEKGAFRGLGAMMEELKKLDRFAPAHKQRLLEMLFGSMGGADMRLVMDMLSGGTAELSKLHEKMASQASLDQRVRNSLDTLGASLTMLTNAWGNLKETLGSILAPTVRSFAVLLSRVTEAIASFSVKHPTLVKWLMVGTIALGGLVFVGGLFLSTLGAIGFALPYLVKGFGLVTKAVGLFGHAISLGGKAITAFSQMAVASFGSVTAAAVGMGIIAVGVYAWIKVFEQLSDATTGAGRDIRLLTKDWESFALVLEKVGGFFAYLGNKIVNTLSFGKFGLSDEEAARRYGGEVESRLYDKAREHGIGLPLPKTPEEGGMPLIGGAEINNQIAYSPTITFQGTTPATTEEFKKLLEKHKEDLAKMVAEVSIRHQNLRYAGAR